MTRQETDMVEVLVRGKVLWVPVVRKKKPKEREESGDGRILQRD